MKKKNYLLELACGTAEDALAAAAGGADRVELCSAMFLGGLTPSIGAVDWVRENSNIEIFAMLRPRAASFSYSEDDYQTIKRDAKNFLDHGVSGLVLGFLTADNRLDLTRLKDFRQSFPEDKLVCHRAFDIVVDWREAMEELIELGFVRILTSGQAPNVLMGKERICEMVEAAAGRIEIMPGGGLKAHNIDEIIRDCKVHSVHMNLRRQVHDPSGDDTRGIHFGGALYPAENLYDVIDSDQVAAIRAHLDGVPTHLLS